jgi:hypothetical protein
MVCKNLLSLKIIKKICLLATMLLATTANADIQSPYKAKVTGRTSNIIHLSLQLSDGIVRRQSPIVDKKILNDKITALIPSVGRTSIKLKEVQFKSWDSSFSYAKGMKTRDQKDLILVSGNASVGKKTIPVGGAIFNNSKGIPELTLIMQSKRGVVGRSLQIKGILDKKSSSLREIKISSLPESTLKKLGCGNEPHAALAQETHSHSTTESHSHDSIPTTSAVGTIKIASIATDADPEWYAKYGDSSNAQIATLISAAHSIYRTHLGIGFRITAQNVFTSSAGNPYTSSNANTLLSTFRNYTLTNNHLGSADLYHLFSGKDFEGSTIGLAWVAVVCKFEDYSFGITQAFHPSADAAIVAHELGHNFGADHDSTDTSSIMAPWVNVPGSTYFSTATVNAIQSHLNSTSNCFDNESDSGEPAPTPNPTPAPEDPSNPDENPSIPGIRISTSLSNSGTLTLKLSLDAQPVSGCKIVVGVGTRKNRISRDLFSFTPNAAVSVYRVVGITDPIAKRSTLSFDATYSCSTDENYSDRISNINLDKVKRKFRGSTNSLVSALSRALQQAVRSRRK